MPLNHVEHVFIQTSDVEGTRAFYTRVPGMHTIEFRQPAFAAIFALALLAAQAAARFPGEAGEDGGAVPRGRSGRLQIAH